MTQPTTSAGITTTTTVNISLPASFHVSRPASTRASPGSPSNTSTEEVGGIVSAAHNTTTSSPLPVGLQTDGAWDDTTNIFATAVTLLTGGVAVSGKTSVTLATTTGGALSCASASREPSTPSNNFQSRVELRAAATLGLDVVVCDVLSDVDFWSSCHAAVAAAHGKHLASISVLGVEISSILTRRLSRLNDSSGSETYTLCVEYLVGTDSVAEQLNISAVIHSEGFRLRYEADASFSPFTSVHLVQAAAVPTDQEITASNASIETTIARSERPLLWLFSLSFILVVVSICVSFVACTTLCGYLVVSRARRKRCRCVPDHPNAADVVLEQVTAEGNRDDHASQDLILWSQADEFDESEARRWKPETLSESPDEVEFNVLEDDWEEVSEPMFFLGLPVEKLDQRSFDPDTRTDSPSATGDLSWCGFGWRGCLAALESTERDRGASTDRFDSVLPIGSELNEEIRQDCLFQGCGGCTLVER